MAKSTVTTTRTRRREKKNITSGVAHVNATFNNTLITIADAQGNAIAWSSAGSQGFRGSRKSTPYAAQVAAEDAGRKAQEHGMKTLEMQLLAMIAVETFTDLKTTFSPLVTSLARMASGIGAFYIITSPRCFLTKRPISAFKNSPIHVRVRLKTPI